MSHSTIVRGAVALACLMAAAQIGAQAPSEDGSYNVPRTAYGHPDLQGFWTNASFTPVERPEALGEKAFYTDEELDQIIEQGVARGFEQTEPGTVADVHYDFSQFGLTRGQDGFVRNLRTSIVVDPPNGRIPPMTADGEARAAARTQARRENPQTDRVQNMALATRCIIWGSNPPLMPIGYNSNLQIVQAEDHVMILVEMMQDARVIPLDGRAPLPEDIRQWKGASRGYWDGDTLVITTANFTGETAFRGASEHLVVTERLTRISDDRIRYEFTVDDPHTWVRPWSGEYPMEKTVGPIFESACHEHNYGVRNTLAGARAEEQRQREAGASE